MKKSQIYWELFKIGYSIKIKELRLGNHASEMSYHEMIATCSAAALKAHESLEMMKKFEEE